MAPEHPLREQLVVPECKERVDSYCDRALNQSELNRAIEGHNKTGAFTGSFVTNPLTKEQMPVFVGDYVLMCGGTGIEMGVPGHDEADFEFARTYQLDIRPVLLPDNVPGPVAIAVAEGEIPWEGPGRMVPYKSLAYMELELEGVRNTIAAERVTAWLENKGLGRRTINYKLRDWLFSRQRYWGEPIPIIHWEDGELEALGNDELPLLLPDVPNFQPHRLGESRLSEAKDWVGVKGPKGRKGLRDVQTMPNWAGSCWYYLRFTDPHNNGAFCDPNAERAWLPVDLYVGGEEQALLHLLYARFWHKVLFDLGHVSTAEPFKRLETPGPIIIDRPHPRKTTNPRIALVETEQVSDGVPPLSELIDKHGADVVRMHILNLGPLDKVHHMRAFTPHGPRRFLQRLARMVQEGTSDGPLKFTRTETPEMQRQIATLSEDVSNLLENLKLHTALARLMAFAKSCRNIAISRTTAETLLLLVYPFAPHTVEELRERLGLRTPAFAAAWPKAGKRKAPEIESVIVQIDGKKRWETQVEAGLSDKEFEQALITWVGTQSPKKPKVTKVCISRPRSRPSLFNLVTKQLQPKESEAGSAS
jgi:leucyl-tRNA synthetase